ncbi:hypothetical protein F5144DRAFT_33283 [Chaetomium tenue]|uniref:Uncharacterized protein n=1 Tax=Chaetomium tenue TaxID=1854479 RepID=A0ACB7PPA6_9PEZI|nr:hypothetical protein F5144DRAFT_33283 [Chaetomium globosum]
MEPPTKRPRFGPAPFEHDPNHPNYEDPEADELNERPEAVNARRDPAARLERSRAFAAFKLKSAFERIFEKYERDFTGVGDEIDLRTGEIVVDNGHVHSLKDAELGGGEEEEEGEEEGDGVSEAGSLNEEERMVRGRVEKRLSRVGGEMLPSMAPQVGEPPFVVGGWSSPTPMLGGPPLGFSGLMYPGQMSFGMPMQYGTPISMPTTDPTWRTPELPSPFMRNALTSGDATGSAKQKTARLSLSAARKQDAGDEDDVFLDVSRNEQGVEHVVKQKVLLPRPPPEKPPAKRRGRPPGTGRKNIEKAPAKRRGRPPGTGRKNVEKAKEPGKDGKLAKSPAGREKMEKKRLNNKPTTKQTRTPNGSLAPGPARVAEIEGHGVITAPASRNKNTEPHTPGTPVPNGIANQETEGNLVRPSEPVSPSPSPPAAALKLHGGNPGAYINGSDGDEKLVLKPQNQTLRVEISITERFDARSFRILSPEPSEVNSPRHPQKPPAEAFSRNFVDPAYAFSDDDEPALPRGKPQRKASKTKPAKTTNSEHGVFREISQNVGSGTTTPAHKLAADEVIQIVGSTVVAPSQSPARMLGLDYAVDHDKGGSSNFPEERSVPRRPVPITGISGIAGNDKSSPSEGTYKRRMTRRKSMLGARLPLIMEPDSRKPPASPELNAGTGAMEVASSPTDRQSRLSKAQSQKTPARAVHHPSAIHGRSSLKPPMRQEIPETSPSAQPAVSPSTADGPVQIPEVPDSDPPFSSEEQIYALSSNLERDPSPTLTDPSSKPQPSPALPKQPQPQQATPHTPVKAPNRRRSKSRPLTSSTTTTKAATKPTTTTTRKSTGVLSLLPTNNANDDEDEEDELSILSPAKPSTTTRTTPAGHHVRLGLWTPGLTGTKSASASASKLKKAVLAGGGTALNLNQTTPTGGRGRRRSMAPWTPSSSAARLLESELVQTPGGTMRRCGEGGFRCEREFCFSCL